MSEEEKVETITLDELPEVEKGEASKKILEAVEKRAEIIREENRVITPWNYLLVQLCNFRDEKMTTEEFLTKIADYISDIAANGFRAGYEIGKHGRTQISSKVLLHLLKKSGKIERLFDNTWRENKGI